MHFAAGYRWSKAHYRNNGGPDFDLEGHGPLLGFQYTVARS